MHAGTCIVSDVFQQQLREQVLSEARQAAESAQQQRRASTKTASASQPSAGQQKSSNTKSGEETISQEDCMQPHQVPQPHWLGAWYCMLTLEGLLALLSRKRQALMHSRQKAEQTWTADTQPSFAVTYCLCFAVSASKCKACMSVSTVLARPGMHYQVHADPQRSDAQVERQQLQQQQMTAQTKTGICPRAKEVCTPLMLLVCHGAYKALCTLVLHCMQLHLNLHADLGVSQAATFSQRYII